MKLHSLSISGLATMNLHALNNEGSEGNALMTRMVEIVDENGNNHTVNAVSGDMFKHIQAEHLFHIAQESKLPLCKPCETFNANRIRVDRGYSEEVASSSEYEAAKKAGRMDSFNLGKVIERCVIDDCEGNLLTDWAGSKSLARKSCIEFGWVVGRPETTRTDSYFHVKFQPEGREKVTGQSESAEGQIPFHRPASSGQYAVVLNLDLFRVGRNDITMAYVLDGNERQKRIKSLIQSVLYTFIKPTGAHRNTQNPHIVNFEGVVAMSTSTVPAPTISALNSKYPDEIARIAASLNRLSENAITVETFKSL
ncbi:MAG: DevR family CRISPR-associated autoregulator, partial [Pseudomonadota bacterium]